ncbi:LysR family transcriptional regulator [Azospirillum sp. ST 5-10]|uniref:LysR family transcriptional regulator n=1 Tax=unclassified Azospirillum TaxID=2630922 RepID=UPI003F4A5D71
MDETGADSRFLRRGLKISHLRLLAALAQTGQMSAAAEALGISQPAASRLAAEAERIVGVKLYERTSRGIALTACGQAFAQRIRRMMDEIGQAERELAEIAAGDGGTVNIGAVTGPAVEHMLPAIRTARVAHPGIAVNMEVATSDVLTAKLLDGTLDFALARRPRHDDPALYSERVLAPEPVSLVVRTGHPLLRRGPLELAQTVDYDWVLPLEGTLLRTTIEARLVAAGIPLPRKLLNTSSILLTLVMVNQTNAVAPMASSVAAFFGSFAAPGSPIQALSLRESLEVEPYALLLAAGRRLTPAARVLHDLVSRQLDAQGRRTADAANRVAATP